MSDTLYLQLDQNIQINHPHIYLQDIAKLSCSNSKILNRLRVMPVINLDPNKPDDPTPMQIQMRLYEENVNKTLIKDIDRTSEK